MSDLVERLRTAAWAGPVPCPVCDVAADEIERLRELLLLCAPSLQRDGRPHVWTMVQVALGNITASQPPANCAAAGLRELQRESEALGLYDCGCAPDECRLLYNCRNALPPSREAL